MASAPNVLRVNRVEEQDSFRAAVRETILTILNEHGETLVGIAEKIDVQVDTISGAFNCKTSLSSIYLQRLARVYGPHTLDPFARAVGGRVVPLVADASADALPTTTAAIHKLALARSPDSPGGERITHCELLGMEAEIDAALRALTNLKVMCGKARAA